MSLEFDILIVEDEIVIVEAVEKILAFDGFKTDSTSYAEAALQRLHQNKYKLILLDLMLPSKTGFEFIKNITSRYSHIPIIVISGYATLENAIQSFKLGVFDFIPKPFDNEELLGVIHRGIKFAEMECREESTKEPSGKLNLVKYEDSELKDCYLLGNHSWAKVENRESVIIGIGKTFSKTLGKIKDIKFPVLQTHLLQGDGCLSITSQNGLMHRVWSPLSGDVIETNYDVERNNNLITTDPFRQGWLICIRPTNLEMELKNLTVPLASST